MLIELDPVDRITADAVGEPGSRVFYLQARQGERLVTILVEKQQVQLLAASVVEILSRVGKETAEGPGEDSMSLEPPIEPEWRAGRLSIGYHDERDLLLLEVVELVPEDEDDEEEEPAEDEPERPVSLEEKLGAEFGPELGVRIGEAEGEEGGGEGELMSGEGFAAVEGEPEPDEPPGLETLPGLGDLGEDVETPRRVRLWATREQMLSLARHGSSVCAAGRPRCQLCGNPIGPEGHLCPALNGHRAATDE